MGQISRSLESRSPRNQRVLFHLTSFLNSIFIITLSAIKMWLYYSLYRPQSIHKIVPNRINWFVLMIGLALERQLLPLFIHKELPRGDPRGSCSPLPPSSHSTHPLSPPLPPPPVPIRLIRSLQFWNLEPGIYWLKKRLFAVYLGLYSFSWLSGIEWTPIQYVSLRFRERRVQLRSPPQPNLCVKSSPIRYDFLGGAKVVRYGVPQTVAGLFSAFGRF